MSRPTALPVIWQNIPVELRALDRWVLWKYTMRNGKWAKPPYQSNGSFAMSNDPSTWSTFEDAVQAYKFDKFDGLGMILPEGMVGVDLDDCIFDGQFTEPAELIKAMLPTYREVSPSGTGIKFIAAGQLSHKLQKVSHSKGVEMYDGGDTNRYFTMTGQVLDKQFKITGQRESLFAIQNIITEPMSEKTQIDVDPANADKAREYLRNIKAEHADEYTSWMQVGMALNWCDKSDAMLDLWISWSSTSDKFDEDVCRRKWESFNRSEGRLLTVGYLEKLAIADGYKPDRYQTRAITAEELLGRTIVREYVVEDMLVVNEPMIIGGASKSLKTSVALEMALSISTGTKFLNTFEVKMPRPVMFVSGESGAATIQENLAMMARAKNLPASRLRSLHIGFKLPKLDDLSNVDDLIEEMREKEIEIMFIDPLYRSLRVGDSASNVYSMGAQLELIAEKIQNAGISTILLHHFRKQGRSYDESPELEDLSQAGISEFGRQFLLLKRREVYKWDGKHTLWFNWGGSAGHQGQRMLEVFTGVRQTGLVWETTLRTEAEWEALQEDQKKMSKVQEDEFLSAAILEAVGENPGIKIKDLVDIVGSTDKQIRRVVSELEDALELHAETGSRGVKLLYKNRME